MFSFRKTSYCLLLCILPVLLYSQSNYPKTLLWRITGKGLTKPSYLFGTMHLNDQRLFRFDDSVYSAIEKSDGLAIEVNPDEMGAYLVNKLFDELQGGKKLEDLLTKKDFTKYKAALSRKFDKPAEQVTTSDVVKEKNKWMSEYLEKGEMPTFVDAYLYSLARRQGKWLGGIEDMGDQANLLDDMVDRSDIEYMLDNSDTSGTVTTGTHHAMDNMIDLYMNQDIQGIDAYSNEHSTENQKDMLLINRNVKMARRIDSLTAIRTMFLAIGAAHLAGDSGVIELLRKRGLTVEPVFSNKKIEAKDYVVKEVPIPWYTVQGEHDLYSISMPGNPATVKLYGFVEMKFLLDIFNMAGYCTMAMINPNTGLPSDSTFKFLSERMLGGKKIISAKAFEKDGIKGKDYIGSKDGEQIRMQILVHNKMIYVVIMSALKKNNLVAADANQFFESFTINKKETETADVYRFTDSVMGISLVTPSLPTYNKQISDDKSAGWKVTGLASSDPRTGSYILLFSKDIKPGYHILSDSTIYKDLSTALQAQYRNVTETERTIQGYKVVELMGQNIDQPTLRLHALCTVQNNRNILLMVISDSVNMKMPQLDTLFTSFSFIQHPAVNWQKQSAGNNLFSAWAPDAFREHEPTITYTYESSQWISYDTTTATTFYVIPDTLSKYRWFQSDSAYWDNRIKNNMRGGMLIMEKDIRNGDMPGKELLIKRNKEGVTYYRMRLLLNDTIQYQLFAAGEKEFLYSRNIDSFFTSFKLSAPYRNTGFITKSKAQLLLNDLASTDSATSQNAIRALMSATFSKEDVPFLQQVLLLSYKFPYGSTFRSNYVNNIIINNLVKLDTVSTIAFIKSKYPSFTGSKAYQKSIAIAMLAKLHTTESYTTLAQLIQQSAPEDELDYIGEYALKDSLALTAGIYHSLQTQAGDSIHAPLIASITIRLLDSGFIKNEAVLPAKAGFLASAAQLLPALVDTANHQYKRNIYSLVELLGKFNTPECNAMLRNYLHVRNKDLKKEVAIALMKNNQSIPTALNELAADKETRGNLYDELKKLKKTALFPQKYLTQFYLSESAIRNSLNEEDDEDPIANVKFLVKKIASFKGKKYLFYLYKVSYDASAEEPETYLGIAGGYDINGISVDIRKDITGVYMSEAFDPEHINDLFKAYLKSMEEDNENSEAVKELLKNNGIE